MKKVLAKIFSGGRSAPFWISLSFVAAGAAAVPLQEARVSQVIQDVRLLEAHAAPRPAVVNDKVTFGSAVRTGVQSRTELTFNDLTITRLGANTIFSFTAGARQAELTQGAILLQVPPKAAPVRANTTGITVAVTGGTALLATGPPAKFMVLEGIGSIYPRGHPEKAVTVHGGEMVLAENGRISNPEKFDVKLVLETSALIVDFPPLANLPLILAVVDQQLAEQQLAGTTSQPLIRNLIDVIDVTDQNANANPVVVEQRVGTPSPTVSPTPPPPSKFGTPSVITSPNPYLITTGTVITTDPSITTNGVTDFGKIYRGATDDGVFSLWAFGSTSAFDTALNIDTEFFADPNHLPIAVFEFQNLSLVGEPTIDTSNGGVTNLALIGVDGITSGAPGGVLTFTGLDLLLLATVNGSINLTSDVSFQGLNELVMYARGAGSNLILNSPISNIGTLELAAEGSIQLTNPGTMSVGDFHATAGDDLTLQIGGSLLLNGKVRLNTLVLPGTTVDSGANLTLNVTGDYTSSSSTEFSRLRVTNEGAHIGTGANINVNIGGDLTTTETGGDFALLVQNTTGQIDNGGNMTLNVNGNVSTQGQLSLLVENYDESVNPAGHIGTGGNVSLTTGGNLTADSTSVAINNRGGGMIDSGVNLTIDIAGALTTFHDAPDFVGNDESLSLAISSRYDNNTAGSFIGGDATLLFDSDSASIGGFLAVIISDRGGTIDGNALLNFSVTHDMTVQEDAVWQILNDSGTDMNAASPIGGTIHGSATLLLSATNLTVPEGLLEVSILNKNGGVVGSGGTIDSDATITFTLTGDLSTQSSADFAIRNQLQAGGTTGGTIGGSATINVTAANISTGVDSFDSSLDVLIANQGGSIGGSAIVNVDVTDDITAQGPANFTIDNSNGGMIGGAANVAVNVDNDLTASNGITLAILNGNSGHIVTDADVLYSVGGTTSTTNLTEYIDNSNGGAIDNGGNVTLHTVGPVMLDGGFDLEMDNFNGGTINNGANVTAYFVGDVTATLGEFHSFNFFVVNGGNDFVGDLGGGTIGTGGNIDATFDGDAATTPTATSGSFAAEIANDHGNIGTGGNISLTIGGNVICSGLFVYTSNRYGGQIGTGGNVTFDVVGNVTTAAQAFLGVINNGGSIGSGTNVTVNAGGDFTTQDYAAFQILNNDDGNGSGPGTIGGDATINVTAANISTGGFFDAEIDNFTGGSITGNAMLNINVSGNINTQGDAFFQINNNAGTIGGDAAINVSAANITANSLLAQIDNTGGSIGGNATINMNVSSTANVTTDATVAIYGSDGAASAAININGGNYNAGGQFLTYIDGDGTITFNNASAHADVLKVGALGANGVLNIGGGILSADTTLKLYASGSNGQLNFLSNVTLGGSAVKILAANAINILDGIVVTIGGGTPAEVYTNNANYTGFGGNGTTTGTFAGAGANNPLPLNQAPPFGAPPPSPSRRGNITTINVSNTADLLALLDGAVVGPDGRITISDSKNITNLRNLSRIDMSGLPRGARRMLIHEMRDRSTMRVRGRQIL